MSLRKIKNGLEAKDYGKVVYLRKGRKHRASGTVVGANKFGQWVQPDHRGWKRVTVTTAEIAAASDRPIVKRAANRTQNGEVRKPKPKPKPVPRWKELVKEVRVFEIDHQPLGWPAVRMGLLTALADELESAHSQPHLPL